jgi:GTP-binding protein Era
MRFFAAEYVREQILHATKAEVPHSVAVSIENFHEPPGAGTLHIDATIAVDRDGQKRILIGAGGEMLKRIGTQARLRIEELTGRKVNLKLWVKILPAWRESREQLGELGYKRGGSGADNEIVIEAELPAESESEDDEEEDEENPQ